MTTHSRFDLGAGQDLTLPEPQAAPHVGAGGSTTSRSTGGWLAAGLTSTADRPAQASNAVERDRPRPVLTAPLPRRATGAAYLANPCVIWRLSVNSLRNEAAAPALSGQTLPRPPSPLPEIFLTTPQLASRVSRDLKQGRVRRLAPSIYTTNVTDAPESLVRRQLWQVASLVFPNAVITDRTAFEAGPSHDGSVFLAAGTAREVALPGVTLRARKGSGPLPGDTPFLGLHMASRARAYLENVAVSRARKGAARRLSRAELEKRLESDLSTRGESYVNTLRDDARKLAPSLGLVNEFQLLDTLVGALLGTRKARLQTETGSARAAGKPYDPKRLDLFGRLHADLLGLAPAPRLDPRRAGEERYLPFFEAYFSNFIEGTEFEIGEAAAIVFEGRIPQDRPEDAHDVLGTFRVVSDRAEMVRTPETFEHFIETLRSRHASVMEGRPEKSPGSFKTAHNRAGDTFFVAPELVPGTLSRGFELHRSLPDAFQRAVFMMFLVSEVHPFVDGNGRIARIMMNAELVSARERRIIIPTVFRSNYLTGLKALSHHAISRTLIRSLDFLQRYTLAIDFSTLAGAQEQLEATNAFRDPQQADAEGVRLVLP